MSVGMRRTYTVTIEHPDFKGSSRDFDRESHEMWSLLRDVCDGYRESGWEARITEGPVETYDVEPETAQ